MIFNQFNTIVLASITLALGADGAELRGRELAKHTCPFPDFPKPNLKKGDPNGWTWCWPYQGGHPGGDDTHCWSTLNTNDCPKGYLVNDTCVLELGPNPNWTPLCVKTDLPCCKCFFGNPWDRCPSGSCPC